MLRSLLAAVVTALAVMVPAAAWAQAPQPTLSFDQPCYSAGDTMGFSGAGYTPSGEINVIFGSVSTGTNVVFRGQADPAGAISGGIDALDPDRFLEDDEFSGTMLVRAYDQTEQFGETQFTLSRFEVEARQPNGSRPRAGKRLRITAVGFTHAVGETLFAHYTRAGKRVKSVRLGRLAGECGDRRVTLRRALPRGLRRGTYRLVFNHSATNAPGTASVRETLRLR
jgi:hypothetical protein